MFEPFTQRLQRLSEDERAVSPVVGFVLIFALIMLVFTIYQADVVPAQNKEVEFKHSQRVESQMSVLNDKIIEAAATDDPRSVTIDTGVQYPSRALAINPGSPVGSLQVLDPEQDVILDTNGNTPGERSYDTSFVSYQSNYNVLQEETEYSAENGMLVKDFSTSDNTLLKSEGTLFSANGAINLVLLNGTYSSNSPTSSLTISSWWKGDGSDPLRIKKGGTLKLPTSLSEAKWEDLLASKQNVSFKSHQNKTGNFNTVTLRFESATTLNVIGATAGNKDESDTVPNTRTLENETRLSQTSATNETANLTVSVRGHFGQKISPDNLITTSTTGAGSVIPPNQTANDNGDATFTYIPDDTDNGSTVTVNMQLENTSETVSFELTYPTEPSDSKDRDPLKIRKLKYDDGELTFKTPGSPVYAEGFSVRTKKDLKNLNETHDNHEFTFEGQANLEYESDEPIQFDGQEYTFEDGPQGIQGSNAVFKEIGNESIISSVSKAESYEAADLIIYIHPKDKSKRPIYIDAEVN